MTISLNSTRLLAKRNIPFQIHSFPDTIHSAVGVAEAVGKPPAMVYKTLVVLRTTPRAKPMLVMVAGDRELNLKKVAAAVGEKKVRMASRREAERLTGLKVGGISALALLNRGFDIFIDRPAQELKTVLVSAGRRGVNVELAVQDLVSVTGARWIEAT
ncbi:MAG: aminoacyl-tRNA deacylase [Caldilineae bacterium]|nr:MAG: aminoacyl-tRNA deacylase [Caldilineae bacterium]